MAPVLGLVPALVALAATTLPASATDTATAAVASSEVTAPAGSTTTRSTIAGSTTTGSVIATSDDVASRFAGSVLVAQLSANLNVFDAALQLTQNPTVDSLLLFAPRYHVADWLFVRARLSLAYELTDSDVTTKRHELELGDGVLGATFTGIPSVLGAKATLGAQLTLPLSKVSRAKTLLLGPAVVVGVSRELRDVVGGTLSLKATGSYARPIYGSITPRLVDERPYAPQCHGGATDCFDQLSGAANVRDALSWGLAGAGVWGPISVNLTFDLAHQFPYPFSELEGVLPSDDAPSVRMISSTSLGVTYALTDVVGVELSYSMMRNLIAGDGTWGNPFYDRYQDMRLNVGATLDLERFYDAL
ncbi:hypothetical protein L6R52_24070 [Myxococcota bacterium]|nr:hypothetical protein [Myxococcota bacterium]